MNILKILLIFILSISFTFASDKVLTLFQKDQKEAVKASKKLPMASVDLEGKLETVCSIGKDGKVVYFHRLVLDNGKTKEIYFEDENNLPASGSRIKIKKVRKIQSTKAVIVPNIEVMAAPTEPYSGLGEKKVLVYFINYSDKNVQATMPQYQNIYNNLKTFFWDQSFNKITVNGTIYDKVITVPLKSTDACNGDFIYGIIKSAQEYALSHGFDYKQFEHHQFVLPPSPTCGWCGLGSVNGPYTWINNCNSDSVVGHELGHNFGLLHSNKYNGCDANWNNCTNAEYGDGASMMGVAEGEFVGLQKEKLKWMSSTLVEKTGEYSIVPIEKLGAQILKIKRPVAGEYYYVEFRQPIGYDKKINSNFHKQLGIHVGKDNSTASWRLMTTSDFSDPAMKLNVKLLSYDPNGAKVSVKIGDDNPPPPPPPPTDDPVFTVTPAKAVYPYNPGNDIWSSVSVYLKKGTTPMKGVTVYYKVFNPENKVIRQLNRATDSKGYVKFGLPITKTMKPGIYIIKVSGAKVTQQAQFEIK